MDEDVLRRLDEESFMAQAETLARLVNTPEWKAWENLIREYRVSCMEEMAAADPADIAIWQGAVRALEVIINRPHEITDLAIQIHNEEQEEVGRTIRVRRELELFNGPLVDEV